MTLNIAINKNNTQHYDRLLLYWASFILSVTNKPFRLSVVMLSVAAPIGTVYLTFWQLLHCQKSF